MFVLSKIFLLLAEPGNLLVVFLAAGAAMLFWRSERVRRTGRCILALAVLAAAAAATTSLPDLLLAPLENRFPQPAHLPERIAGIIVLGGAVDEVVSAARGQVTLTPSAARLSEALALARRHPEARILFSGGSGRLYPTALSEAEVAKRFFEEMGVDAARLTFEERSRNTYENALFSKRLAEPKVGQHWVLVTSAAHMPRAAGVFRAQGWEVIPYPVDYRTTGDGAATRRFEFADSLMLLNDAAKEWMGLAAYRLLGRTNEFFPAP